MILLPEQDAFTHFRRALRHSDQVILDDLLTAVQRYQSAAACTPQALPVENLLLALLIEEHKEVIRLRNQVSALHSLQVSPPALQNE